jgi:hypothetical protein
VTELHQLLLPGDEAIAHATLEAYLEARVEAADKEIRRAIEARNQARADLEDWQKTGTMTIDQALHAWQCLVKATSTMGLMYASEQAGRSEWAAADTSFRATTRYFQHRGFKLTAPPMIGGAT